MKKDWVELKVVQKELNKLLLEARKCKRDYIEQKFLSKNNKRLWESLRTISNMDSKKQCFVTIDDFKKANELNAN